MTRVLSIGKSVLGGQGVELAMRDLKSPGLMYFKAVLMLCCGLLACAVILMEHPSWRLALLLGLAIWGFCRAYYFAFYVIEHYIDPGHKFAGLGALVSYFLKDRRADKSSGLDKRV